VRDLPKRLGKKLERREDGGGPKRLSKKPARLGTDIKRNPLSFIEPAPNPMQGLVTKGRDAEDYMADEVNRLQEGFLARAKAERFRFSETTRSDYYCTIVFEHGDQRAEFLKQAGYRETDPYFVDGTILAAALGIELPPSPFKLRPLRAADRSLRHLVTVIPKQSGLKGTPE
jgi:hypothetical protein